LVQRQSTIARWCERIIEGGWLLAVVLIPSYFNLLSSRHFEPDKATSLRAIVMVMIAAGLVVWLDRLGSSTKSTDPPGQRVSWWRRLTSFPMALPVLLYVLVFFIATVFSVARGASIWGSYQRLQGTYTNLSYIGLGVMVVLFLRRREQLERLLTVAVLGSLPAIGYGLVQHFRVDPLPWKGDVISRVASTMGNSIFVAAYLIMVLPFALYLAINAFHSARHASREGSNADYGWAAGYTLLILGSLSIAYAALCFGAVVRVPDLRYWWVYPGAIIVAFALFLVPALKPHTADRVNAAVLVPGVIATVYGLLVGLFYNIGKLDINQRVQAQPGRGGTEWPVWMIGGVLAVLAAYALFFTLPRIADSSRRMLRLTGVGMTLLSLVMLVTIVFTQSRGPWLGGLLGVFVFFTSLLFLAWRRARSAGSPRARLWSGLLVGETIAAVVFGAFIIAFNFLPSPVFDQLRATPYIGRLGTLLESESGTGLVRKLIWVGDDKAGGAVALITADPVRTIIGWGPESMFVAYNKFYPPSLANIEARGASPDRSHQAYLDELVTKGLLGLASYIFVIVSVLTLAVKLLRRTDDWGTQVLLLACVAVIVTHLAEGVTGIPIVATLMLLWITIAVVVVSGLLMGEYSLTAPAPAVVEAPSEEAAQLPRTQPAKGGKSRRQGAAARGAAQGRAMSSSRGGRQGLGLTTLLIYGIILSLGLAGAWFLNVDNVYADMRFQQGQIYAENSRAGLREHFTGAQYYIDAIKMEPDQDFYYLSLGRSLMNITDIQRQMGVSLGEPDPSASVRDLLQTADLQTLLAGKSLLGTLSYAEAVLTEAYTINPRNKDHSANLGRLHTFWYSRLENDPKQLEEAIGWYARAHDIAPQDVVILNEYAGSEALLGTYSAEKGDSTTAQTQYEKAHRLLEQSKNLDPRYADTDVRMADLLRVEGRITEAVDQYVAMLERNPRSLDSQISLVISSLADQPDQLTRIRESYEKALRETPGDEAQQALFNSVIGRISVALDDLARASEAFAKQTQLQPQNYEARLNYTLVLSNTQNYQQAVTEAEALLSLAQQQQQDEQQNAQIQALIDYLQQRAAGG
jgi:tetratricopeptide (TPR) repeat protein